MAQDENEAILSFGDWVRQRREALGLTRAVLARRVGCATVTVKKIERDERRPSLQLAQLLADHLAIPDVMRGDFLRMARGHFVPGLSAPQEAVPPPAFLQPDTTPAGAPQHLRFVARERELAWLDAHLDEALAGHGRFVFVLGEAGLGKTTLMAEFARRAQAARPDLVVAGGQCNAQAGIGDPYLPFRDVMGLLTGDLESGWAAGTLAQAQALRLWAVFPPTVAAILAHGPDLIDVLIPGALLIRRVALHLPGRVQWLEQLQALHDRQPSRPGEQEQDRLLEQVTEVFRAVAARQPLLLLLDDLQWVDDASNTLIFHLGRRLAGSRILVIGAYRPSEVALGRPARAGAPPAQHPLEPVVNEFKRHFGDVQLSLGWSDTAEGQAFVDALLDSEPNRLDATFRQALFHHTGGHPLFAIELLRDMQEGGRLVQDENGRWVEGADIPFRGLPARVEAVIEQRLGWLNDPLRDLLTVASVEGERFTVQIVARILGLEERTVLRQLSRRLAQRHRLVREHGEVPVASGYLTRFRFSHVLFQEYLYERLGRAERRRYHRDVAEALEDLLFVGSLPAVVAWPAEPAAEAALPSHPAGEWLDTFGPALARHFWRGEVWGKAAVYALYLGARAMKVYALREALAYFERALQALDALTAAPPALVYVALIHWEEAAFKLRPYEEQLQQLARAEAIAREAEDRPGLIQALHWTANVHLARGLWTRAGPALMECLALAEALGDERLAVRPAFFRALMASFADPRRALALAGDALALARTFADRQVEVLSLAIKGQLHAQLGAFAQSRMALEEARALLPDVESPLTASDVDLMAAWAYLAMGDRQNGLEYGQRSVARAKATDNIDCICSGLDCVGYSNLELQQIPEATAAFAEAIERSRTSGAIFPQLMGEAGLAMAQFCSGRVAALDNLEAALEAMQRNQNYVGAANAATMLGACLTQLGDGERAEAYLTTALDFYRRVQMRPFLLRTLSSLAQLWARQGRDAEVQRAQAEADSLLAQLSSPPG